MWAPISLSAGGALARGWLDGAIATDIAPGPLERAGETVRRAGLAGRVQLRWVRGWSGGAGGVHRRGHRRHGGRDHL